MFPKLENAEANSERYGIKDPLNEEHSHFEHIELFYEKITWTYRGGHTLHCDAWNERTTAEIASGQSSLFVFAERLLARTLSKEIYKLPAQPYALWSPSRETAMGGSVSRKQPRERFMENLASLLPKTGTCSVNSLPEQSSLPALRQPLLIYIAMKQKSRVLTLDWEKGLYWSRARHKE